MKALVGIANVYNSILEETEKQLVIIKDGKTFIGALFFKQEEWEIVKDFVEQIEVDGSVFQIIITAYNLKYDYGMLAKDDKTLKTMLHWQYVNGFSEEMFDDYRYETDTEYLKSLGYIPIKLKSELLGV